MDTRIFSENSAVRVGLVIVILGFVTGAIWWAATLQSDVRYMRDSLEVFVRQQESRMSDHESRLRALERRP